MSKLSPRHPVLQYLFFGICSILFWLVYYYFSSKNLPLSLSFALSDTVLYMIGYTFVSSFLLPKFFLQNKVHLFIGGFLFVILVIGTTRVYAYQLGDHYFGKPFTITVSSLIYVFATTTFVLSAISGVRFAVDWLQSQKRIEEISKERATAELDFLKGQLNPHFFFNSINTLYGSIDQDNEIAELDEAAAKAEYVPTTRL